MDRGGSSKLTQQQPPSAPVDVDEQVIPTLKPGAQKPQEYADGQD